MILQAPPALEGPSLAPPVRSLIRARRRVDTVLDELAGNALDETAETDLEAVGASEVQSRLDVRREVRVVLPGIVEEALELTLPLLAGEARSLAQLIPRHLTMGEAGDIVVEQGKHLGPRVTVETVLGQHPHTELPIAARVRTKTWLDAEEHEPWVAAKGPGRG